MTQPLFPIKPIGFRATTDVLAIDPYRHAGARAFDGAGVELHCEPFDTTVIATL